jgi:hypothetical protein
MLSVTYHDGSSERSLIVDGVNPPRPIRSYKLSQRLAPDALGTLKTFWEAHVGGVPFYFYDPCDVLPGYQVGSNYDSTGAATQGRVACIFTNTEWTEVVGIAKTDTSLELREVA